MQTRWASKFAAETIEILLKHTPPQKKKNTQNKKKPKPLISANIHLLRKKITFQNSSEITSGISDKKKITVLSSGEGIL